VWIQNYDPLGWWPASTLVASLPVLVLLGLLVSGKAGAWQAALAGLVTAGGVAIGVFGMPADLVLASAAVGVAFALFRIAWLIVAAVFLYDIAVETGQFEVMKASIARLSGDRRLQAVLVAFSFGAFIEGAAGFGAPVAVSGAMLAGLGFNPFYAAGICLLANTAPVAFGSIGIPVTTLANVTGLDELKLSAMVGRLCAMISVVIPGYLIVVMAGWKRAAEVLPAIIACGVSFAAVQFYVSNYMGPALTDILSSLACIIVMVAVLKLWKPKTIMRLEGDKPVSVTKTRFTAGQMFMAWVPYLLLVVFVLLWGEREIKPHINAVGNQIIPAALPTTPGTPNGLTATRLMVPGLHNQITRVEPVVRKPEPYGALYELNWLSASGTACFLAILATALVLRVRPRQVLKTYVDTFKQLKMAMLTIASMLGLAYLMNYSGMTSTLGLALSATGGAFPFFSAVVGWLGVFLTGSDTSANALFGNLQVVTANTLGLNPILTASVNSAAGVMGKMISVQSIAVAVAATGMTSADESRLFRFTIKHSVFLMICMAIISMLFAYVFPHLVPAP
jgi:lactate permease